MVKVHFLSHFDTQINKFLYLQDLDRFGYFSFSVHEDRQLSKVARSH